MHQISAQDDGTGRRRKLFRLVCPAYPAFNVYSGVAKVMTALGPVCVATAVQDVSGWDAEVVDENNYRRGPKDCAGTSSAGTSTSSTTNPESLVVTPAM